MPWLEIFSGSLAISVCGTLLVCRAAISAHLLDQPLEPRKVHVAPVPRLGGLGIVAGVYGSLIVGFAFVPALREEFVRRGSDAVLALVAGGIAIAGLGFYDDLYGADARTKFAVQCCVALLLYWAGFRIVEVENPLGPAVALGALSLPVTLLWIVGVINAVNLIDGLDGLAGGIGIAAALALAVLAAQAGHTLAMLLATATIGALLGFLVFNVNPASIFMGDTGSLFLGAVLAVLGTLPRAGTETSPLVASAVILGIPIADTLLAMARRFWRGVPMFCADRGHMHHRLLDKGLSHRHAVLALWGAASLLAVAGTHLSSDPTGALVLAVVVAAAGVALQRAGMFEFLHEAPRHRWARVPAPAPAVARVTGDAPGHANILGYAVDGDTVDGCVQSVLRSMRAAGGCHCVECINPHSYAVALGNRRFRDALMDADTLLPDGAGIVLAARWLKQPVAQRVTGSDLFQGIMHGIDRRHGDRVFFLGATEDTLATIREKVRADFPNAVVAGTYSPPFVPEFTAAETDAMIEAVNAAHADVLWVGMTAPKQEIWLHENRGRLEVKVAGAIGAVFDFYAGKVKRSPRVFQQLGLEWLPRLVQEPRRLWRRTFVSAPVFLWHTLKAVAMARVARGSAPAPATSTAAPLAREAALAQRRTSSLLASREREVVRGGSLATAVGPLPVASRGSRLDIPAALAARRAQPGAVAQDAAAPPPA